MSAAGETQWLCGCGAGGPEEWAIQHAERKGEGHYPKPLPPTPEIGGREEIEEAAMWAVRDADGWEGCTRQKYARALLALKAENARLTALTKELEEVKADRDENSRQVADEYVARKAAESKLSAHRSEGDAALDILMGVKVNEEAPIVVESELCQEALGLVRKLSAMEGERAELLEDKAKAALLLVQAQDVFAQKRIRISQLEEALRRIDTDPNDMLKGCHPDPVHLLEAACRAVNRQRDIARAALSTAKP